MTIRERVCGYLATHPGARPAEIAAGTGLTRAQVRDVRHAVGTGRASTTHVRLPTLMRRGSGPRQSECAGYVACLAGAAHAYPHEAHCPPRCESYEERDHSVDVAIGASVARESVTGGIGEAEQWAGGGW